MRPIRPGDAETRHVGVVRGITTVHPSLESSEGKVERFVWRQKTSSRLDLEPSILAETTAGAVINTDQWGAYCDLTGQQRGHASVCYSPGKREWARDDDGDGIREVHNNTLEGFWTSLRNFLRPFRGLNKVYLQQYIAMHQWAHNL
jgi:hypothetical protein